MSCVYLGELVKVKDDRRVFHDCHLFGRCVEGRGDRKVVGCDLCKRRLLIGDEGFADRWADPLIILDRNRTKTESLRGMLGGRSAFLACGGPSAGDLSLELLNGRGMWTLCVNNMAGHARFRPQAMLCSDPPFKFSHSIWLDPGIMKFAPTPKARGHRAKLKRRTADGEFVQIEEKTFSAPNTWFFQRWSWMQPDDSFFLSDGACWGNHQSGVEKTGQPKTVSTMLLALRVMSYLGAGRIYLVGVDFKMSPGRVYSFNQDKSEGGCESNNRQFAVVNEWLCEMQRNGTFGRFGLEVFNCYEMSSLRAFPFAPFEEAVEEARGIIEEAPSLEFWYDKIGEEKKKKRKKNR